MPRSTLAHDRSAFFAMLARRYGRGMNLPGSPARPLLPAWLRVIAATLAFMLAAMSTAVAFLIPSVREAFNSGDAETHIWAALAIWPLALVAYLSLSAILTRVIDRAPLSLLGLRLTWRALAALAVGTAVSVLIALAVAALAAAALPAAPDATLAATADTLAHIPLGLLLAYLVARSYVLQGIGEEVLMRGYLMASLRARPRLAILISAIAFTLPHLMSQGGQTSLLGHIVYLAVPFGFSLSAAAIGIAFRSVWGAVGIHGGFHIGLAVAAVAGLADLTTPILLLFGLLHAVVGLAILSRVSPERWAEISRRGPYAAKEAAIAER